MFRIPFFTERSKGGSARSSRKMSIQHTRGRRLRHEPLEDRQLLSATPGWAFSIGGSETGWEESDSIAVGAAGDIYVLGQFHGTADFDPSPDAVFELTALGDFSTYDRFVAKYSSTGEFRWARHLGGYGYEGPGRIALDGDDNVYFVTSYTGQAHLDGNSMFDQSGQLVDAVTNYGTFFAKFDTNGGFEWVQQLDGDPLVIGGIEGFDIAVHQPENTTETPMIYIVGRFRGTVDFDPSGSTSTLSCLGEASDTDVFVAKYDTDGNYLWAQRAGGPGSGSTVERDSANGVAVDAAGNAYAVGYFHGTADFGDTILTAKGRVWDAFVAKLDVGTGEFMWAERMGGDSQETDQDRARAVAVSASGDVYVGGNFYGTADFGSTTLVSGGSADAFLSKLDDSGTFIWTRQFGAGGYDSLSAVALDVDDHVYMAGRFSNGVDFDPGAGNAILTAKGESQNIFVAKVDSDGGFLSARRMGGQGTSGDNPRGIQVFGNDIITTGVYMGLGDFDTGTETIVQTSSATDVFVVKTTQDRGAIFGRMFIDANQDGVMDANEVTLADRTVFLDQNQNGVLDAEETSVATGAAGDYVFQHLLDDTPYYLAQQLPPGWEETAAPATVTLAAGEFRTDQDFGTFAAADISIYTQSSAKNLGDNRTVTSTLNVADTHNILDLNVTIDISHANVEDLSATLISPNGTRVSLFYRVGGTGDNFTDTVLDDQATTPIGAGTAPFTGSFIPVSPLANLAGETVNGTWGLEIRDYTKGVRGTLNYWSLEVTHLASGPVNTPPTAFDDSAATDEDVSVLIAKTDLLSNDSDPDGNPISITGFGTPGNGSVADNGDGTVTYTPDDDFNGADTFTYTISDGNGGTDTATVTVDVTPVADPSVAVDDAASTTVGTAVVIDVLANDYDPDGDTISISSFTQGTAGTVTDSGNGTLTYTPTGAVPGFDFFSYTISGGSDTATVSVDILAAGAERVYTSVDGPLNIGDLKTVTSTVLATFDDPVNAANVAIDFTHAAPETLVISLFSPDGGDSLDLVPSDPPSGLYGVVIPVGGVTHTGTWTLQIYDTLKDRQRGMLYGWTLTVNPTDPAPLAVSTPSANDLALLSWVDLDSSDDDDSDILTQTLADDLALMLVE